MIKKGKNMFLKRLIIFISIAPFFGVSAMQQQKSQQQESQDHLFILLQKLVSHDKDNSIIIFPIKTNDLHDTKTKRKKSEEILSDIALNGVRVSLGLITEIAGKSFLVVDNKVDNYEDDPAQLEGWLCRLADKEIIKKSVNSESTESYGASFIVYNMPYYKQNEGCFDWAYGENLCDLLEHRKDACLVLIDEDIYNKKEDIVHAIYRQFYGKKKVLQYDKTYQKLTEYEPGLFSEIPFPTIMFWSALASVGLYCVMQS